MDPKLIKAIQTLHAPAEWVHLATIAREGTSLGLMTPARNRIYGLD